MWLLLIKCSKYDFYNIICVNSMFMWPYMHSTYSCVDVACVLDGEYLATLTEKDHEIT
jgi:hypothetical protein